MKFVTRPGNLALRFVAIAGAVLFSQQAMAVGAPAGVDIDNIATVNYQVGNVAQTAVASGTASFTVDNRVDFSMTNDSGTVTITVGQTEAPIQYTIANVGNQVQDYRLNPTPAGGGDFAMINVNAFVETNGSPGYQPGADTDLFVDELAPDTSIVVYLVADSPDTGEGDGDTANVDLEVITADGNSAGQGGDSAQAANPTAGEDVVLAVGGNFGQGNDNLAGDYLIELVVLGITKGSAVQSDPFGNSPPYAVPGSVVRYTIDVSNPSTTSDATDIRITDSLNDIFVADGVVITLTNAVLGGVAAASCVAEAGADTNNDGCQFTQVSTTQQDLIIGNANADFTIAAGNPAPTLTIEFDATIRDFVP